MLFRSAEGRRAGRGGASQGRLLLLCRDVWLRARGAVRARRVLGDGRLALRWRLRPGLGVTRRRAAEFVGKGRVSAQTRGSVRGTRVLSAHLIDIWPFSVQGAPLAGNEFATLILRHASGTESPFGLVAVGPNVGKDSYKTENKLACERLESGVGWALRKGRIGQRKQARIFSMGVCRSLLGKCQAAGTNN